MAIAQSTDRLTLKAVLTVCNQLQDEVSSAIERERHDALPAPEKPDQAVRDAQIDDYEKRIKPVLTTALLKMPIAEPGKDGDGRHAQRIAAELAARRARNESAA